MEIQCPSCQKKLSIGDQFAGQLVKCPACGGVFMAPSLAMPAMPLAAPVATSAVSPAGAPIAAPVVPQTQSAMPDVIPFSSEAPPRPNSPYTPPLPKPAAPSVHFEEEPPGPPSDFNRSYTLSLCPDVLRWVAPVALAVIFVLSFFTWIVTFFVLADAPISHLNLWDIAFGSRRSFLWILYLLLTLFAALPLSWAKLLMEMNLVPTLDVLKPFWYWRSVAVGGVVAVALTFATLGWMRLSPIDSTAFGMFVGLRAHLIALIAYGLEFWLADRKKKRLPLPELTVRW